jgi:hypothetical protein
MDVWLAWDGDKIGWQIGRLAEADDEEGVRRKSQDIERGNAAFASWVQEKMGSLVSAGGDEGRARIPADALEGLQEIRAKYEGVTGAPASVGVGLRLSQADKALLAAKLRGGDRVVLYVPEIEAELARYKRPSEAEKIGSAYLAKADPPAPPQVEPNGPSAGGGFRERQEPGGGGAGAPAPPQVADSDHSAGEAAQSYYEDHGAAPFDPDSFAQEMHGHAQQGDADDQAEADRQSGLDQVRSQVVQILQQVRQQAPQMEQIKQVDLEMYEAIQGLVAGLLVTARALVGQGGDQPPEQQAEVQKAEGPFAEAGFRHRRTGQVVSSGPTHDPTGVLDVDQPNLDAPEETWAWEPGFITHDGKFMDRFEAGQMVGAKNASPEHGGTAWLDSTDPESGLNKKECKHFYGKGDKCLKCKSPKSGAELEKGLPLPESQPTKHVLHLPVGATKGGKVRVRHADGKTSWVSVRAGQVLSNDGHATSSRNPAGR